MKKLLLILTITIIATSCGISQNSSTNDKKGFIADGYDVTAYFDGNAIKGDNAYISSYNGANYKFKTESNKKKFDANPAKYEPAYGGFCAYAIGKKNNKVGINPKSFLVEDGRLFLFYDTVFADTRQRWLDENPEALKQKADEHWKTLKTKN